MKVNWHNTAQQSVFSGCLITRSASIALLLLTVIATIDRLRSERKIDPSFLKNYTGYHRSAIIPFNYIFNLFFKHFSYSCYNNHGMPN